MLNPIGSLYQNTKSLSFKQNAEENNQPKASHGDKLLVKEKNSAPFVNSAKITMDKFQNAITVYPIKGLKGSKNSNFYEFLTMGMFPYVTGSLTMMAVFNAAAKHFTADAAANALKHGKKMALGVLFYGVAKNVSKKLIEQPIKWRYGVDVNMPYKKEVNELPESKNDKDLISHEYHKVFESVDFPRWDLLYDNEYFGDKRNSYYDKAAKKMGYGENLADSDQIVKPKIKELLVKSKTFTTLSSYLWSAVAVGIAMQKPWESLGNHKVKVALKEISIPKSIDKFCKTFAKSCKEFVQGGVNKNKSVSIAAKSLLIAAAGVTLLGNLLTLVDFSKRKSDKAAAASLIDDSKPKVVC